MRQYNYVMGKLEVIWKKHSEIIVVAALALLVAKIILAALLR
ncbi:MAG TPA: hypothetical protein VN328_04265 [Thermodesulfovibrionales bacterium]|nr:hypothetical protein [Thermodesulfovibrionales bacterium]